MIGRPGRLLHAFAVWAHLAAFGIVIGVLALLRNFEREGAGARWRRAHTTGAELDALLDGRQERAAPLAPEKRPPL